MFHNASNSEYMCTGSPWIVLRAINGLNHLFVDACHSKLGAFVRAHELAREHQQGNGGEIQFGRTAHAIPPRRSIQECEFVAVDDDPMWVVFEA